MCLAQVLKAGTGGKLCVFASTLPKVGTAALSQREQGRPLNGTAAEKEVQKVQEPAHKHFRDMAANAADFQVGWLCFTAPVFPNRSGSSC